MESVAAKSCFNPTSSFNSSSFRLLPKISVRATGRISTAVRCCSPGASVAEPSLKHVAPIPAPPPPPASSVAADEFSKFREASKKGNLVPLCQCIFSDHLTPVVAYRCLVKADDWDAPSFMFESVEPGFRSSVMGRYSVVGAQPTMEIIAKENFVTVLDHEEGQRKEEFVEDPMMVPRRIMEGWKPQLLDDLPDAFCGEEISAFPLLLLL
ncbi:Allatostatin [Asimina triloba]